jgi:hypothetical protein
VEGGPVTRTWWRGGCVAACERACAARAGFSAEEVAMPFQFQSYGDLFMINLDGSGLKVGLRGHLPRTRPHPPILRPLYTARPRFVGLKQGVPETPLGLANSPVTSAMLNAMPSNARGRRGPLARADDPDPGAGRARSASPTTASRTARRPGACCARRSAWRAAAAATWRATLATPARTWDAPTRTRCRQAPPGTSEARCLYMLGLDLNGGLRLPPHAALHA